MKCEICGNDSGVGLIASETLNADVCDLCNDLDHWIRSVGYSEIKRALKKLEELKVMEVKEDGSK
jgi:hypothetical protein